MKAEFTPFEKQFYQRDEVAGGAGELVIANTVEPLYSTSADKPYNLLTVDELEHPSPDANVQRGYN